MNKVTIQKIGYYMGYIFGIICFACLSAIAIASTMKLLSFILR